MGYVDIAFTRYGASNKQVVGKTNYFPAKCINITRQMALRPLHSTVG